MGLWGFLMYYADFLSNNMSLVVDISPEEMRAIIRSRLMWGYQRYMKHLYPKKDLSLTIPTADSSLPHQTICLPTTSTSTTHTSPPHQQEPPTTSPPHQQEPPTTTFIFHPECVPVTDDLKPTPPVGQKQGKTHIKARNHRKCKSKKKVRIFPGKLSTFPNN